MRVLKKMPHAREAKHFHAYIKKNYIDKDKGNLNYQDFYSVIIKYKILLAFPNL
jgi:hypothetical protein